MTWHVGSQLTGGFLLLPNPTVENVNRFSGADEASAESARDSYFTANPNELEAYNQNEQRMVVLVYGGSQYFQNRVAGSWVDTFNSATAAVDLGSHNVTELSDVSNAGSGQIITTQERVNLNANTARIAELTNVDNTSDANKPVSTAQQSALDNKQDNLVSGTNIKTINGQSVLGSGNVEVGGLAKERKPVFTAFNQPDPVDEGSLWTSSDNTLDRIYPGVAFLAYDYTGTPGTFSEISSTGSFGGLEPVPGTYTLKVRAAWPFGQSDEQTLTIQVNSFTLNRDNMFGDEANLQGTYDFSSQTDNDYIAFIGAVADDGGNYEIDRDGSIQAESANCLMFYSVEANRLVAFRINSSNSIDGVYRWTGVTSIAHGASVGGGGSNFLTTTSQKDAAIASSVRGKRVPFGGYYNGGLGARKCLSLVPSGSEFNGFGSSGTSWSYCFQLADDWIGSGTANQMLSPVGDEYFVNTIVGFGIGSSPYEYAHYGDEDSGPYTTSTNGVSWDIATDNWVIGQAGDLVVVTFDGTNWRVYVEGTLKFQSSSIDGYMNPTTSPTELRFGDLGGANVTDYPLDYNKLGSWYARMEYLGIAVGTAFDQTQVNELVLNKADLTQSNNYTSITTLGTFTAGSVNNTKGNVTYSRVEVEF